VGFAARRDVDLAVPVAEDFDGLAGGGAEAEETDAFSGLSAGDAEAAEADDAGAEKRSDVCVAEGFGERVGEVGADEDVFGVASIDGVAGEGGVVAEILFVAEAEGAGAVGASDPGDTDAHADGAFGCSSADNLADDLVAGDEGLMHEAEVALEDVEVGAADTAGEDAEHDLSVGEHGHWGVFDLEDWFDGRLRSVQDGSFHGDSRWW